MVFYFEIILHAHPIINIGCLTRQTYLGVLLQHNIVRIICTAALRALASFIRSFANICLNRQIYAPNMQQKSLINSENMVWRLNTKKT